MATECEEAGRFVVHAQDIPTEIERANDYLKKVFKIDSTLRLQALDDEDLRPLSDSL